jgi:crotonobetaine/carnitine-CoA ligase
VAQVPVNPAYRGDWLTHVVTTSGARVIVVESGLVDALSAIDCSALADIVVVQTDQQFDTQLTNGQRIHDFATFANNAEPVPPVAAKPSDIGAIHFTSGTTGRSKGAIVPLAQMDLLTRRNAELLDLDPAAIYFTELPLYHINAQMTVQGTLLMGAQGRIEEHFSASRWIDRVRASGATHTSMLGVMVDFVLAQQGRDIDTDHRLRSAWTVPCVPVAVDALRSRFAIERIVTSYGTTETGMIARRVVTPGSLDPSSGEIGYDHYDLAIVDPDTDAPVAEGAVGEIVLRPRAAWTTMQGYVAMPERTAEAFRNLWLHSGDAGRIDEAGQLCFVDRLHDRIRRRGENVSSADLEHVLSLHPQVSEVAVVALPSDDAGGEDEIKACLVLTIDPAAFDSTEFWTWCEANLPYFAVPRYLEVLTELPKTSTAKVLKAPLRASGAGHAVLDRGPASRRR